MCIYIHIIQPYHSRNGLHPTLFSVTNINKTVSIGINLKDIIIAFPFRELLKYQNNSKSEKIMVLLHVHTYTKVEK
jgi:hypothetical protein